MSCSVVVYVLNYIVGKLDYQVLVPIKKTGFADGGLSCKVPDHLQSRFFSHYRISDVCHFASIWGTAISIVIYLFSHAQKLR